MSEQTTQRRPFAGGPMGRHGGVPGEKAKDFKKTWIKLIRYCKDHLPAIGIALSLSIIGTVLTLAGPGRLTKITDLITAGLFTGIDLVAVAKTAGFLAALYLFSFVLTFSQGMIMAGVTQKISKRMRADITAKINRIPLRYFDKNSYGNILSRVTNDVDTIGQTMNQSIGQLIGAIVMFVGSLLMMFLTNPILAVSAIGATVIG
ncbi:MAG: ABC transporter transmembrane domain-containing protein, partial [bacterium]